MNYRVAKFLNLSLGAVYAMGAYVAYFFSTNFSMAILISVVLGVVAGLTLFFAIKYLSRNIVEATIVSLGFAILLEELLRLSERTSYFLIVEVGQQNIYVFGENLSIWLISAFLVAAAFYGILLVLYKSEYGLRLKFIEEDSELAEMYGVSVERYIAAVISATSALLAVVGCLLAPTHAISPLMGFPVLVSGILLAAFATVLGGVGIRLHVNTVLLSVAYSYAVSVIV